ncbi:MAG: hypothetical protein WAK63_05940 [Xanthobacteraceae bacterium]
MADYYPVLARAVSRLAINDAQARREVYERAQAIVIAELRRQDLQISAPEIMRELAALETAIRRVEAESLSHQSQAPEGPTPPHLTATSSATADNDIGGRRESLAGNAAKVRPAPAQPKEIDTSKNRAEDATNDMGRMPELLGAMLVRTTFIVGMLAFIALIYIRGLVLVSEHVIGFPILIVVITMTLCVFILLPLAIIRKARIVPAIGFVLRYTYSLSRRIRFPYHT